MIKGLDATPKPCINNVLIEAAKQKEYTPKGYIDLYTNSNSQAANAQNPNAKHSIRITLTCALKSLFSTKLLGATKKAKLTKSYKGILSKIHLVTREFTSKSEYAKFLTASDRVSFLKSKKSSLDHPTNVPNIANLADYTYIEDGKEYINIPITYSVYHNLSSEGGTPGFLAYIVSVESNGTILPGQITSEVIFDGGNIPEKTGYFRISDSYEDGGEIKNLLEAGPLTGQIGSIYGAPGDIWVGAYHFMPQGGDNYRAMAGSKHDSEIPHPYLDFVITSNSKILDARSTTKIESLFAYKSSDFENAQKDIASVIYSGLKKKNTIDEYVANKGIVSEIFYSIDPADTEKKGLNNNNLFFAIDKMKLLKEYTKLPGLLDNLITASDDIGTKLAASISIFYFEISKINKQTGVKQTLITGNNDTSFSDIGETTYLRNKKEKGYKLRKRTSKIFVDNKTNVDFYDFRDAVIDKYDDATYEYEIKLKFKDPMLLYLTQKLSQTRRAMANITELQTKFTYKFYDKSKNKHTSVFDVHQNRINKEFLKERLEGTPQIPFTFPFSANNIPASIEHAFPPPGSLYFLSFESLNSLLFGLNVTNDLQPISDYLSLGGEAGITQLNEYIRKSLKLTTTTPSLIGRVLSLLSLIENKLEEMLMLYTTEKMTKKSSGYTSTDHEKSLGNTASTAEHVLEFTHRFKKPLALSKTKNSFNWVNTLNTGKADTIKTVSRDSYIASIQGAGSRLLSDKGREKFGSPSSFSYSFLPYSGKTLELFNSSESGYKTKYMQTIKKMLTSEVSDTPESVVTPEVLAQFGMRFPTSIEEAQSVNSDTMAKTLRSISFKDNFGESYERQPQKRSAGDQNDSFYNSFGEIKDPRFDWAGDSLSNYPLSLADSLINIIFSDNAKKSRNLNYFNQSSVVAIDSRTNVFQNKELPYLINLFSAAAIASPSSIKENLSPSGQALYKALFSEEDGKLKINNYALYVTLFGLYGRVHYLEGFEQRSLSDKLTPSSYNNANMIKSAKWSPVTKEALDRLAPNQSLFCKVSLFENSNLLDAKILDLFKGYYNYNQYFYIG